MLYIVLNEENYIICTHNLALRSVWSTQSYCHSDIHQINSKFRSQQNGHFETKNLVHTKRPQKTSKKATLQLKPKNENRPPSSPSQRQPCHPLALSPQVRVGPSPRRQRRPQTVCAPGDAFGGAHGLGAGAQLGDCTGGAVLIPPKN